MTFSEAEKEAITSLWEKVAGHADVIGAEALERLMTCFPQTKTYFSHFDLSHGSTDLRRHGGKVFNAIGNAVHHLNDLHHALSHLSDLHTQNLKVDSGSFKLLSYAIQVTLASRFPKDFTPAAHTAWDKFLYVVSTIIVQNTSNPDTH